jgi:hypothetical protein
MWKNKVRRRGHNRNQIYQKKIQETYSMVAMFKEPRAHAKAVEILGNFINGATSAICLKQC